MSTSGVSELNFLTSSFFAYILEVHHHFLRKRMERLQKSSHIITVELYVEKRIHIRTCVFVHKSRLRNALVLNSHIPLYMYHRCFTCNTDIK